MTRAEKVKIAQALRAEGAPILDIAAMLDVSRSSASDYLTDPTGARARARKAGYAGSCAVCGASTSGCNGRAKAPTLCSRHANQSRTYWTRDRITTAIKEWHRQYGYPPRATDWNPHHATRNGDLEAWPRFRAGIWPYTNTVQLAFGSWNAGIAAAGFVPLPPGTYRDPSSRSAKLRAAHARKRAAA